MERKTRFTTLTTVISAMAAVASAVVAALGAYNVKAFEARQNLEREGASFVAERLNKLYVPVRMHLASTRILFKRYFESTTTLQEKVAIEHEMRIHNKEIRERLMHWSVYIASHPRDCRSILEPDELVRQLLEHLIQWETVYRLKYEYKVYKGPVFAGIEEFGSRTFPEGVDEYFDCTERVLRSQLHARSVVVQAPLP